MPTLLRTVVFIIAFGVCIKAVWAGDERSIKKLRDALVALAPDVDPGEAELVSVTAHTTSRSLAREYRVVWCAGVQNILINTGRRQRGFCGHYTRDIGERLRELKVKTLVLHWGAAFAGTMDENNGLVVTAINQPFENGILMDGWRNGGRLFWCALKEDSAYDLRLHPPRRPEPPGHAGTTAWRENLLYTAWLQDYKNAYNWQWQSTVR
ncbi:MAG: hypothetical protein WCD54_19270 [Pseudolabrys sp.]